MAERLPDQSALPPPGRRSGMGSASLLPYLIKSLALRPQVPAPQPAPRRRRRPAASPGRGAD